MVVSMRLFGWLGFLALAGCAARGAPSKAPKTATDEDWGIPPSDLTPPAPFSQSCQYRLSKQRDTTVVECRPQRVMVVLPGDDWKADNQADVPGGVLFAESKSLRISIVEAEEVENRDEPGEHLTAVYDRIAAGLPEQGFSVGPPHVEEVGRGMLVLSYEMTGSVGDVQIRSVSTWAAKRGLRGRYFDYQVSFTQAADNPGWRALDEVLRLTKQVAGQLYVQPED